jgi:translocation and assembly module TamB
MLKLIISIIKWALKVMLISMVALSVIFLFAQTKFGREGLTGFANYLLKDENIKIEVSGLSGIVPHDIKIDHLTVHDKTGKWLDIRELTFKFSPLYLLEGRLFIREFSANSILLDHFPESQKSEEARSKPFSIPSFIYHIGLERLKISRLSLGKDILGKPATFSVGARVTNEEAKQKSSFNLNIERTDGANGSAYIEAEISGADPYLKIDAGIDEPEPGIFGGLTGLRTPIFVLLKGEGPFKDWKGSFSARADELVEVDATLGLLSLDDLHMNLDGKAIFHHERFPKFLTELSMPETSFSIKSHLKGKSDLIIDSADLKSDNASLSINGSLDLKKSSANGIFNIIIKDVSPFSELIHAECFGDLNLEGDFKGPISRPAMNIRFKLNEIKIETVQARELEAEAHLVWQTEKGISPHSSHITSKGVIKGFQVASLTDLPEKQIVWDLDMTGPDKGLVKIQSLQLTGDTLSTNISGAYDFNNVSGIFDTVLSAQSLVRYSSLLGTDIPAGLKTEARIHTTISKGVFISDIDGRLNTTSGSDDIFTKLVSPEINYSGNLEILNSGILKIAGLKINSEKADVTGSMSYIVRDKIIQGTLNLQSNNIAAFAPLINRDIAGSLKAEASFDGPMDTILLKSQIKTTDFKFDQVRIQNLTTSLSLKKNSTGGEGIISFVGINNGHTFEGRSVFKQENKLLTLNEISLQGPGINFNGDISYDRKSSQAKGELIGACKDLSIPASLFNLKLQGSASIKVNLNPSKGKFADFNLLAKNVAGDFGKAEDLNIMINLSGETKAPEATLKGSLVSYEKGEILLKRIDINASGILQDISFALNGTGHAGFDMQVETEGHLSFTSQEQSLRLDKLQGKYGVMQVYLMQPLRAVRSGKSFELSSAEVNLSGGILRASGKISEEDIHLNLKAEEVPVSLLQLAGITDLEGTATGSVSLTGSLNAPDANLQLVLNNLRLRDSQYSKLPPFNLSVMSQLKAEQLHADLSLEGSTGNRFRLEMESPFNLSLSPMSWSFPQDENFKGNLSGKLDLENFATLIGLYDHAITGSLDLNFDIAGTLKSPEITGHATIENGSYENLTIGTSVKKVAADITAKGSRFILTKVTGEEGRDGTVTGTGFFDFSPARNFPYNLTLDIKHMPVIRTDTINLTVWGKPSLSGDVKDHGISGKLIVEKGEYRIQERLPAEITELQVREINGPTQEKTKEKSGNKSIMKLDLSVESEGQLFLNGRGLNSEWKGDITLKGTTHEPIITGRLSVLRGTYNFLGKRFNLTNGLIDLDGQYPPDPNMNVTGRAEAANITAIINITGPVRKLAFELSSEPTLPQDEILSQLLFGQEMAKISPFQAVEIASDLNAMLGKGNMDIVGKTKSILGVDQLEVKQEVKQSAEKTTEESTVTVGKYLSNSFYIKFEKGLGPTSGKASVKWDITPNLSLDTEIGESATTGVGINWKWDY